MIVTAGLVSCAVWQTAVARACSAESTEHVRRLYMVSSIGFLIRFLLPNFLGICALAYVFQRPELAEIFLPGGQPASPEVTLTAMPVFLSQILPAGLIGLVGAGMLAAFMSTHDSYLLCWASVLTQDVMAPLRRGHMTERARIGWTRVFVGVIGSFLLVWSLWYPLGQDLWDYMAVTGAIYFTGAFALLLFGIYWKRASRLGAYLALVTGLCAAAGLKPIQHLFRLDDWAAAWGFSLDSESVGLFTVTLALALMVLGSLLRPDPPRSGPRASTGPARGETA
jgi:SSS family solute:Na+ symporter